LPAHTLISALLGVALVAQAPSGWDATLAQGQQLILDRKTPEAIALFERTVKAAPGFDGARFELGEAHRMRALELAIEGPSREKERQAHLQSAATHLRRAASAGGEYAQLTWGNLMLLYGEDELNRPSELVEVARHYVKLSPASVIGHVSLARALRATGQEMAALTTLVDARQRIAPDEAHLLAVTAVDFVATTPESRPVEFRALLDYAEPALKRAIAEDPQDRRSVMALSALLQVRAEKVETDPARRATLRRESNRLFDQFSDMNPDRSNPVAPEPSAPVEPAGFAAARQEAEALAARNQPAQAADVYRKFTTSHPGFLPAHYLRIDALVRAGKGSALAESLEAARRGVPATAESRYAAATYLFETVSRTKGIAATDANTLLDGATVVLDEALKLRPDYMEALVYKSLVLRTRARYESDAGKAAALIAEADRLRAHVTDLQNRR
jgi:hypothetical protein